MQANASEVTTTDNAPAVFSTITGASWAVSMKGARARREIHKELITAHCREIAARQKLKDKTK